MKNSLVCGGEDFISIRVSDVGDGAIEVGLVKKTIEALSTAQRKTAAERFQKNHQVRYLQICRFRESDFGSRRHLA